MLQTMKCGQPLVSMLSKLKYCRFHSSVPFIHQKKIFVSCVSRANVKLNRYISSAKIPDQINASDHKVDVEPSRTIANRSETETLSELERLSEDEKKTLEELQTEFKALKEYGKFKLPEEMTDSVWIQTLRHFPTFHQRLRHYRFVRKKECFKLKKEEEKQLRKERQEQRETVNVDEKHINRLQLKITKQTINKMLFNNLAHAMQFGPNVVVDLRFENCMSYIEQNEACGQVQHMLSMNKTHVDPVHLHFCNLGPKMKELMGKFVHNWDAYPCTVSYEHYLEFYPRRNVVYLSPDAKETLSHYDENDVYIIGGLVDKNQQQDLTLQIARDENIRTVRLPLDEHVKWQHGHKNLTLNQVMGILIDLRHTNNWESALLEHLPHRKFKENTANNKPTTQRAKKSKFPKHKPVVNTGVTFRENKPPSNKLTDTSNQTSSNSTRKKQEYRKISEFVKDFSSSLNDDEGDTVQQSFNEKKDILFKEIEMKLLDQEFEERKRLLEEEIQERKKLLAKK